MQMAQVPLAENTADIFNIPKDVRVEDFLNDKLQTIADLDNIDGLLDNVRKQQGLLDQQVHITR